jgi:O-succinylhomoserine sulfhydrylase
MKKNENFNTSAIRTQLERTQHREHSTPLYLTSSFMFENAEHMRAMFAEEVEGNIYSRYSNPNTSEFIEKICLMEGAEAGFAFASGMSAVFTSFAALLKSGDHIIACQSLFGSTHSILTKILPKWGISFSYVDIYRPDTWEQAIKPNTKMLYIETPSNPGMDLIDLEWAGKLAASHNLILNVDNCFATPYLQQPIKYGAHISIHSATKFIDGQGRVLGGIAVGNKDLLQEIQFFSRHSGPSMSAFNAWILSKSLETLAVRMDRHCQNALTLAEFLEGHAEVEFVKYPFLPSHPNYDIAKKQMKHGGGILSFVIKGGLDRCRKFLDNIKMGSLSSNLGDTRTIINHPTSTTHSKLTEEERLSIGIPPGLIRVSVGLEQIEDIIEDINQAIQASK